MTPRSSITMIPSGAVSRIDCNRCWLAGSPPLSGRAALPVAAVFRGLPAAIKDAIRSRRQGFGLGPTLSWRAAYPIPPFRAPAHRRNRVAPGGGEREPFLGGKPVYWAVQ